MAKIGIIGGNGNMGKRYGLITKALGHEVIVVDLGNSKAPLHDCDGIIIATPTETHVRFIQEWKHKPILCEKPISKNLVEIENLLKDPDLNLRMINQYEYYILIQKEWRNFSKNIPLYGWSPHTFFNFYKHGADGLIWDCINIIGLSEGKIQLHEDGFIWECMINNIKLDIQDMDTAYVWNLKSWLGKMDNNHDYIYSAHRKCVEMLKK